MPRSVKTQRVLASDVAAAPALARHLPAVRAPLLAFLTARDVVVLLATSHALRDDLETVRFAMKTMEPARCFFRGCLMDWCAATPTFTHLKDFGSSCGDHDSSSDAEVSGDDESTKESDAEQHDQCDNGNEEVETEENMTAVQMSSARSASLLSLAALMHTKLSMLLYSEDQAYVTDYYVVPFILPLARLRAIERERPPPGAPTPLGIHIENCAASGDNDDAACGLCEAITATIEHAAAYRVEREAQEAALTQKLLRDGVLEGSDAFQKALDAFYESKHEIDERYSEDRYDRYNVNDTLAALCEGGQLGAVELCGGVDYDMALETCHDDYYNPKRFCETKLRPLVAFFTRHGFGRVHRAKVRDYTTVEGELHRDEIRSVEMVGAAAPHGFFAGVYFMARYT